METDIIVNNKNIVITGATSGIGFAAARQLSAAGANVFGVGRSAQRIREARESILADNPDAHIDFIEADLSSQSEVKKLAENVTTKLSQMDGKKLDVLVNNAGAIANWYTATEDGYELQFAVNHLAPFLLTHLLLPILNKSKDGRVLTVSSRSHRRMRINWADVMFRKGYNTLLAYKQSKLANVMFTYELNRRLDGDGQIKAYAVDPGLVNTKIGMKGTSGLVRWVWDRRRKKGMSPEESAKRITYLALEKGINNDVSAYWKDFKPVLPSSYSMREDEAERLWDLSERLCGLR